MQTFETDAISFDEITAIDMRIDVMIEAVTAPALGHIDAPALRDQTALVGAEAARVFVRQEGRGTLIGEALYLPAIRRGAFALGADSVWTDADSLSDAVRRVLDGDVVA